LAGESEVLTKNRSVSENSDSKILVEMEVSFREEISQEINRWSHREDALLVVVGVASVVR